MKAQIDLPKAIEFIRWLQCIHKFPEHESEFNSFERIDFENDII